MKLTKRRLRKLIEAELRNLREEEDDDPCWDDYEMVGMKTKDGKEVPNCVPKSEVKLREVVRKLIVSEMQ